MREHLAGILAAGVMVGAFVVETIVSRWLRRDGHHDLRDTTTNVVIGTGYVISNGLQRLLLAGVFLAVWSRSPLRWDMRSAPSWVVLLLLEDFLYYWSHRASHTFRVMWASHAVHHNSPRLNLGTGMRNSWIGGYLDWVFFVPLVALGFHPLQIGIVQAIATAWDFLSHSPYLPRNRWLDLVFNSPSNHRVHHGSNARYVDRNLGGFLIIWDRLFGTYQGEDEPAHYGIHPMPERPYDPIHVEVYLWAGLWADLVRMVRRPPAKGR